jgi:hypothetical protein
MARRQLLSASAYCQGGAQLARSMGAALVCADAEQAKERAARGPKCGHSPCSQNYIETGERECVEGTLGNAPRTPDQIAQVAR